MVYATQIQASNFAKSLSNHQQSSNRKSSRISQISPLSVLNKPNKPNTLDLDISISRLISTFSPFAFSVKSAYPQSKTLKLTPHHVNLFDIKTIKNVILTRLLRQLASHLCSDGSCIGHRGRPIRWSQKCSTTSPRAALSIDGRREGSRAIHDERHFVGSF